MPFSIGNIDLPKGSRTWFRKPVPKPSISRKYKDPISLAFVPIANIIADFNLLAAHRGLAEQPVLDYFQYSYIGRRSTASGETIPCFHITYGTYETMNSRVVGGLQRTTNAVEGWHNKFNQSLCVINPSIWKHIDALIKDSGANHLNIAQQVAG